MTDPIADMLTRINNALLARHEKVVLPYSLIKKSIADILMSAGYVTSVDVVEAKPFAQLELTLRYVGKLPAVNGVRRLSKPGRRLYTTASKIPRTLSGYGLTILSTSRGVLSDKDARKLNVGGELLCQVW